MATRMCKIVWIVAAAMVPATLAAQDLTLVTRGQPAAFSIVRSVSASPSQIYAAEELQKFTAQMTGVQLPILTDDAPLPPNAIILGDTRPPPTCSSSAARCAVRFTACTNCSIASVDAVGMPLGTVSFRRMTSGQFRRSMKPRYPPSPCANRFGSICLTAISRPATRPTATPCA